MKKSQVFIFGVLFVLPLIAQAGSRPCTATLVTGPAPVDGGQTSDLRGIAQSCAAQASDDDANRGAQFDDQQLMRKFSAQKYEAQIQKMQELQNYFGRRDDSDGAIPALAAYIKDAQDNLKTAQKAYDKWAAAKAKPGTVDLEDLADRVRSAETAISDDFAQSNQLDPRRQ